ncbi:hypothetical protein Avbf_17075 [Armadillidium vulgare]|nr:hypothetical protein Avbf_17075 [Armadillidium vulgare]
MYRIFMIENNALNMSLKPKQNPKTSESTRVRKVSLPAQKIPPRIQIDELRKNFKRQISLPKENDIIPIFDPMAKAQESATMTRRKTGIIFDERMNEHYNPWDENFPEKPERLTAVLQRKHMMQPCYLLDALLKLPSGSLMVKCKMEWL